MNKKKILKIIGIILAIFIGIVIALACLGNVAQAAGLVDDEINKDHAYSRYGLDNYQLDFYVDTSWDWLPWNWADGIGKNVMYGLYMITNFIWRISLYISNLTGYAVAESFKLNFVTKMAGTIGKNIQTLAGVTPHGISSNGFYMGSLMILILLVGVYVIYHGLIKREISKAVQAVTNFVLIFVLSAGFIAYAPDLVKKVNGFSSDISSAALSLGTKITIPDSNVKGKDSVDLIRDNLFAIQVRQPWLILQYGSTDIKKLGKDRVKELESTSPNENNGKDREEVVKKEINEKKNNNLTISQVGNRFGTVVFLFIFNIGISLFVLLFAGLMLLYQVLFMVYSMFLLFCCLISMVPGHNATLQKGVEKVFNSIFTRAGITLVVVVAFSISTMFYSLSADAPFFMVAFLQIVAFVGIYYKLPEILGMFKLQSDGQQIGKRMMRKPRMFMRRQTRRMGRRIERALTAGTAGAVGGMIGSEFSNRQRKQSSQRSTGQEKRENVGTRAGQKVGAVLDTPQKVVDNTKLAKEKLKNVPTQAKYAVHSAKENVKQNATDFKRNMVEEPQKKKEDRDQTLQKHRQTIGEKRQEMDKKRQDEMKQKKNRKGQEPMSKRSETVQKPVTFAEKERSRERVSGVEKQQNVSSDVNTSRGQSFVEKERNRERASGSFAEREKNQERASVQTRQAVEQKKTNRQMPKKQNRGRREKR